MILKLLMGQAIHSMRYRHNSANSMALGHIKKISKLWIKVHIFYWGLLIDKVISKNIDICNMKSG